MLEHYATPHHPVQGRTRNFKGISLPWPPLPGKTIKLFFSASPKTLSPHFYSAQLNKGQVSVTSPGIREEPSHMRSIKMEEYFIGKDTERTYLVTVFKCYPHSDMKSLCASKSKGHRGRVIFNVKIWLISNFLSAISHRAVNSPPRWVLARDRKINSWEKVGETPPRDWKLQYMAFNLSSVSEIPIVYENKRIRLNYKVETPPTVWVTFSVRSSNLCNPCPAKDLPITTPSTWALCSGGHQLWPRCPSEVSSIYPSQSLEVDHEYWSQDLNSASTT